MQDLNETTITDAVREQMALTGDPRLRRIMDAVVRHLHDFAREVSLTPQEWARLFAASRAGLIARMSDEGMGPERANELVDAWDDEAGRRGLSPQSTAYWDEAPAWIRERASPK